MTIMPKRKTEMPEFTDTFIKAGLTKGWLIPPPDGPGASLLERLLLWVIWGLIILSVLGLAAYVFLR